MIMKSLCQRKENKSGYGCSVLWTLLYFITTLCYTTYKEKVDGWTRGEVDMYQILTLLSVSLEKDRSKVLRRNMYV